MVEFDGVVPFQTVTVDSAAQVGELLAGMAADPAAETRTIVPVGGGTALGIGNVVGHVDLAVDLSGIRGIERYNPADLTLTAHAGTTLEELQGELGLHGQELSIEAPFPERATIGGLMATAFAGPRRYGSGTLKDALIGASYVRGDGLVAKAGGMVVKNVSGFEVSRFLHGSWGTLAVITSANLKVTPVPKADRTLSIPFSSAGEAVAAFQTCVASGLRPASAEIDVSPLEAMLHVRLLGTRSGVESETSMLERGLARLPQDRRDSDESAAFWHRLGESWAAPQEASVQVVVGVRPRDVPEVVAWLTHGDERLGIETLLVSPGTGTIRARFPSRAIAPAAFWAAMSPLRARPAGTAMIEFAPADWRRGLDVWGPPPASVTMMKSLKREFDPHGMLNRGRMMI